MSKTITSPVKEFPGSVELPDRLTFPQVTMLEEAIRVRAALFTSAYNKLLEETTEEELIKKHGSVDDIPLSVDKTEYDGSVLEALCECIQEWSLKGYNSNAKEYEELGQLGADTFPMTPRVASSELIDFLYSEILSLYNPEVPNE